MKQKNNKRDFISVAELARMLGISRIAVFNRIKKGEIPAQKIGRAYAIAREDVETIISGGGEKDLTEVNKTEIRDAVERVVSEYGETLKLLGKE